MEFSFTPPVRRITQQRNYGERTVTTHHYVDGQNHRMPGVTTIIDAKAKPKLIGWAAKTTAEQTLNNWDQLAAMAPAKRLATMMGYRYETSNKAKDKGTQVHNYGYRLAQGETIEDVDPMLWPYCENYARFLDEWKVEPILLETVIVHYGRFEGYAGTLDMVCDLTTPAGDRERWLVDLKTGDTGIFPETPIQLAGYRYAQKYLDPSGSEVDMVEVENTGAVWITTDEAVLIPTVSGPEQMRTFRACRQLYESSLTEDGLVLPAYLHPTRSTAQIVWTQH